METTTQKCKLCGNEQPAELLKGGYCFSCQGKTYKNIICKKCKTLFPYTYGEMAYAEECGIKEPECCDNCLRGNSAVNNKHSVNKVAYCLLALFLGGLGIHKFYAKCTVLGIVYLLFCWTGIPGLIAFVEFFIALSKKADVQGNICV